MVTRGTGFHYPIAETILFECLSKYGISYLPLEVRQEILVASYRAVMKEAETRRRIPVSVVIDRIEDSILDIYGKPLEEIVGEPIKNIEYSHRFLRSAETKVSFNQGEAIKSLLYSLSHCLTAIYLKFGLLPERNNVLNVSLGKYLLFPETNAKSKIKPSIGAKELKDKISEFLEKERINLKGFEACINFLSSQYKEISMRKSYGEEEIPSHEIKNALNFMKKLISIVKNLHPLVEEKGLA